MHDNEQHVLIARQMMIIVGASLNAMVLCTSYCFALFSGIVVLLII